MDFILFSCYCFTILRGPVLIQSKVRLMLSSFPLPFVQAEVNASFWHLALLSCPMTLHINLKWCLTLLPSILLHGIQLQGEWWLADFGGPNYVWFLDGTAISYHVEYQQHFTFEVAILVQKKIMTTMIWPYFVLVLVSEPPWVMGPLLLWFDVKKNWYFLCNAGLFPESCLFLVKMNWPPDVFVWLLQNFCVPKGSECSSCNGKFVYVEMNGLAEICWNEWIPWN